MEEFHSDYGDKLNFDFKTDENRVYEIGLINSEEFNLNPEEQIELLKEKGYFFFADAVGSEKWLPLIIKAAAFSQNEGDKTSSHLRTDLPLGLMRFLLGEIKDPEIDVLQELLTIAYKYADDEKIMLREMLKETRDWLKNRLTVSLYLVRKLHSKGINLFSKGNYSKLSGVIRGKLKDLEDEADRPINYGLNSSLNR